MIWKYQLQFMVVINCNNSVKLVHNPKYNLHIWAKSWSDLQDKKVVGFYWSRIYDYGLEFMLEYIFLRIDKNLKPYLYEPYIYI